MAAVPSPKCDGHPVHDDDLPVHEDDPPTSNSPHRSEPEQIGPGRFVETYGGCMEMFPGGQTFMDQFRNDQYVEEQQENIYFPWALRQEWGFASWLLCSCLSMAVIDTLLSLEIVSSDVQCYSTSYPPTDQEYPAVLSLRKRAQDSCRNPSIWTTMAMQNAPAQISHKTTSSAFLPQSHRLSSGTSEPSAF